MDLRLKDLRKEATLIHASKLYALVALPLLVLLLSAHFIDRHFEKTAHQSEQKALAGQIKSALNEYIYSAISDILVVASDSSLFARIVESDNRLAQTFERIAPINQSYHQLRFLNNEGYEVVRVDYNGKEPERIGEAKLQNKSHRPYFQSAIVLKQNQVFISRLDLNVERNEIEVPHRPMIRFATPVFNRQGVKQGVLVFNYYGEKLLHLLANFRQSTSADVMLLNRNGYFLSSNDPSQLWGFQLAGRQSFADKYPDWPLIKDQQSGSLVNANGLFTFTTIDHESHDNWLKQYTPLGIASVSAEDKHWHLVLQLPESELFASSNNRFSFFSIVYLLFLVVLLPICVSWGKTKSKKNFLAKQDRIYGQIIRQTEELVYITDLNGVIQQVNPATERISGYRSDELIGNTPRIFKSGQLDTAFYRDMWKKILVGESFSGLFINKRKDGSLFYETKKITPLVTKDNRPEMFVSTGREISLELNKFQRESEMYSSFANGISHHFGNLLNSISGFSQLILKTSKKSQDSSLTHLITHVLTSSKEAETLLKSIRLMSDSSQVSLKPIELYKPVKATIDSWKEQLSQDITVEYFLSDKLPKVACDSASLSIALLAILQNALDTTVKGGTIKIQMTLRYIGDDPCTICGKPLSGDYIDISISDEGEGIADDIKDKIWDPFFSTKADSLLVAETPGLGLPAVRAIIHRSDGHILMESSPDKGTTVHLLFKATTTSETQHQHA